MTCKGFTFDASEWITLKSILRPEIEGISSSFSIFKGREVENSTSSITLTKRTPITPLPYIGSSKILGNLGIICGKHAIHHKINTM
jgi:hypothetical protein